MATARLQQTDNPPRQHGEKIIQQIIQTELDALTERLIQHAQEEGNS